MLSRHSIDWSGSSCYDDRNPRFDSGAILWCLISFTDMSSPMAYCHGIYLFSDLISAFLNSASSEAFDMLVVGAKCNIVELLVKPKAIAIVVSILYRPENVRKDRTWMRDWFPAILHTSSNITSWILQFQTVSMRSFAAGLLTSSFINSRLIQECQSNSSL